VLPTESVTIDGLQPRNRAGGRCGRRMARGRTRSAFSGPPTGS